jgi:hypothetical protein
MKITSTFLLFTVIILLTTFTANAGTRGVVEVEIIEGDSVQKYYEIYTFDDKRFRIDFVGEDLKVTGETPYVMTVDGGQQWVMGDKPKERFYCSKVNTEAFFRNLGNQVTHAVDFFNVKAESPTVKQVLKEPGPEILGFTTTHVRMETNAKAYAWFLFFKFEYAVKIVDDIWYTTDVEIHPIRKKWLDALTQSGNNIIDGLFNDYTSKLPGPVLKSESVIDITNVRKNQTKTERQNTVAQKLEEISSEEMDMIFKMPKCENMDDDEIQEKGKALFSAGKIML